MIIFGNDCNNCDKCYMETVTYGKKEYKVRRCAFGARRKRVYAIVEDGKAYIRCSYVRSIYWIRNRNVEHRKENSCKRLLEVKQ